MKYRCLEDRLLANSVPQHTGHRVNGQPSECWLWIGNADAKGYGRVTLWVKGKHVKARAHRAAHEWFHGVRLGPEETLEHECRQPACIHPNHTVPMSRAENSSRMQHYWRNYRAEQAGQTRIEA